MGSAKYGWIVDRVEESASARGARTQRAVQELVDALRSLRGTGTKGVYGLDPSSLDLYDDERAELKRRIRQALVRHREAFEEAEDVASLLELSKIADANGLVELKLQKRFPLRCDPLGDPEGLDAAWKARVARVRRAVAEPGRFDWALAAEAFAVGDSPRSIRFGDPEPDALYELALRYEQAQRRPFSRELAAVWSVMNGVRLDDAWWYLAPLSEWRWEDSGLCIGGGQSVQGSLTLDYRGKANLADARVIDRDDDGSVLQRYASVAELLDLLLP